jgi:hypothetical protein
VIEEHPDEIYVKISEIELSKVIMNLEYLMDPYNLLEVFLKLKIKNYV